MIRDYFVLAVKNLRKRGIRSWLTMLGIFLGIAAVVALISMGTGLQNAITGQFGTLDADKLIIQNTGAGFGPPGSTAVQKLTTHDLSIVESVAGVDIAIPRLIRIVKVEFNDAVKFRNVASVPENDKAITIANDFLNADVKSGRLLEKVDRGKVVLGNDFLTEDFGKEIRVGSKLLIQGNSFEVVGILEKSSSFMINSIILLPEEDLTKILGLNGEIDMIIVRVDNDKNIKSIASTLERKLRDDRKQKIGEEDFSVQTPLQSISVINTILDVINIIVSGIAAISLFVGGVGIANTMYTSVLERRREIGVMKAIGATNRSILLIFLIEAALLGLVGGVIGAIIGLGLAVAASSIANIALGGLSFEITLSFPLLLSAILFSLVIGILSGLVPAIQAAKLNPVEALRK